MRWRLQGADGNTGADCVLEVEATSAEAATRFAAVKGIFVSSVSPVAVMPPPLPLPPTGALPSAQLSRSRSMEYRVLTQKDRWLSSKFDPATLEVALNAYAAQGWRAAVADTASFPGFLSGDRQEMITVLTRDGGDEMFEYKVLTQKDRWLSGKFDPNTLEQAINAYAQQGWRVVIATSASFPGFFSGNREELILVLERPK